MIIQHRTTKQRTVIRQYLSGRTDHPTAEKLYNEIKVEYPKMSLGTVYRNLLFLKDLGEIQAVDVGDGCSHFDPNPVPHVHYYCTKCMEVSDVPMENYNEITKAVSKRIDGVVSSCNITVTGICRKCLLKSS